MHREGLDLFCKCSSQRDNFHKSSMLCSPNVSTQDAARLSANLGIRLAKHLGKYLGHHIVHSGNNKDAHNALLQCINNRVEGWKVKCLSRVGCLTLAQLVMGSIPVFHMQLEGLPTWVHMEIDMAVTKCVWGSSNERRGVHLLS